MNPKKPAPKAADASMTDEEFRAALLKPIPKKGRTPGIAINDSPLNLLDDLLDIELKNSPTHE